MVLTSLNPSLIAIHGLNGHPFHTWTFTSKKDKSEFLWLRDILPARFPNARIMTFGYDARFIGSSTSGIEDDARDLLERITRIKGRRMGLAVCIVHNFFSRHYILQRSDAPIVFIAHSLGGLVVKQVSVAKLPRHHEKS
jgi:alpha-beta hydrolase superfamily lysophospholipase